MLVHSKSSLHYITLPNLLNIHKIFLIIHKHSLYECFIELKLSMTFKKTKNYNYQKFFLFLYIEKKIAMNLIFVDFIILLKNFDL